MISEALLILADAAPAGQPPSQPQGGFMILMVSMLLIMYVLMIRPQQKRQKEAAAMVKALKTVDKVVTNGGIHGIVSNVKDGPTLMLKVADNVKLEVDKSAIASVDRPTTSNPAPATPAVTNS
jgi:preprotein translocase subunit YajC